jgi:S-adenosylmethionine hydrolase
MAIITLLTDFGVQDEYVGVLKGVVLSTNADVTLVDISHGICAQDIVGAAHMLKTAFAHFPRGTIHIAVVDPGVGTQRAILAASTAGHLFLAPDNGLLDPILRGAKSVTLHRVENEKLFHHPVSRTFHGRDIFAPVAAHLSKGLALDNVGPPVRLDDIVRLEENGYPYINSGEVVGIIVASDRFGNLITNIHEKDLPTSDHALLTIMVGNHTIKGLGESYAKGGATGPMAILGSRDCIEIAVYLGNAARELGIGVGSVVRVCLFSSI